MTTDRIDANPKIHDFHWARFVRAVADEIDVRYPDEKKMADDEIAKRIVDILGRDIEVPLGVTQAVVRDGWVTMTGRGRSNGSSRARPPRTMCASFPASGECRTGSRSNLVFTPLT